VGRADGPRHVRVGADDMITLPRNEEIR
jgi:hypothetical protein